MPFLVTDSGAKSLSLYFLAAFIEIISDTFGLPVVGNFANPFCSSVFVIGIGRETHRVKP